MDDKMRKCRGLRRAASVARWNVGAAMAVIIPLSVPIVAQRKDLDGVRDELRSKLTQFLVLNRDRPIRIRDYQSVERIHFEG